MGYNVKYERGGTGIKVLFPILTEGENKSICKEKFLSYYQIRLKVTSKQLQICQHQLLLVQYKDL